MGSQAEEEFVHRALQAEEISAKGAEFFMLKPVT
jgi:hypothetical protein